VQQLGFGDQVEEELELVEEQLLLIKDLIPVGMVIISIILAFISQWISYKVMNRLENKQYSFPPFRKLQIPVAIIWIYFVALVFTFFDLEANSTVYLVANNVLALAGIFMLIQGFSFMFFYAHYKKWSKAIPIIGIVITLLLPLFLLYFVRILGIIDIGFGL